jgi:hypothetical protein
MKKVCLHHVQIVKKKQNLKRKNHLNYYAKENDAFGLSSLQII